MRVKVSTISLIGADREFGFENGLNIITGPIATGKTTLLRCIRGLFGSSLQDFPKEARETITNIASDIEFGDKNYSVIRPFTTTKTAKVDIAGINETLRLPALLSTSSLDSTYTNWLLKALDLPVIEVRTAPTRIDSDSSPVSINDYMMYCYLRQDEIDNNVLGHTNPFKNIKRKYVFEIAYGKYNIELAKLYDKLSEVTRDLSRIKSKYKTIEEFLENTPFENKAGIQQEINYLETKHSEIQRDIEKDAKKSIEVTKSSDLQIEINRLESELSDLQSKLDYEIKSEKQLRRLVAQLETQSNRITKSIVAGNYLIDFDFIICPRCGSSVDSKRSDEDTCYLCMQHPEQKISRDDLLNEQDRIEKQIIETKELIESHQNTQNLLLKQIEENEKTRKIKSIELDFLLNSYISDKASYIAEMAKTKTSIEEHIFRLKDYLLLFTKKDDSQEQISRLISEKESLEVTIESILNRETGIESRIQILEQKFRDILSEFDAPKFFETGFTGIDRNTYLPMFEGRRFDELQSQGLKVIINVAHVLAQQLTAIECNLALPNILLIDGITANIGHEGLDWDRVEKIFNYLILLSEKFGDRLQIIVSENSIPINVNRYVRARFSEDEKLIPQYLLNK